MLRFLNRLTEKQPIDAVTLERYLLLAQDVPGVSLRAVLEPSTDQPGALNLVAQVSRQTISGLATIDNRAFNETGPVEVLGLLDFNSFTEFGEKTELYYYHAFPNSQNFGQASTEMFLGASGLKGKVYAGYGATVPTGTLGQQGYNGTTTVFGAAAELSGDPLATADAERQPRVRRARLRHLAIARRAPRAHGRAMTRCGSCVSAGTTRCRISGLVPIARRSTYCRCASPKGLKLLGASINGNSLTSPRQGEQTGFFKINFEASRTQTLFTPWEGASVGLMGLLTGQWSNNILPPAEQFYLGGARFTRGYYAGQVPGDKALAATVELQLNTGFETTVFDKSFDISTQFYLFYDWGETWQNLSTDRDTMINSVGGGVRAQVTRYVEVDFEGVARFNRFPNGGNFPGSGVSPLYGGAFYWRVLTRF